MFFKKLILVCFILFPSLCFAQQRAGLTVAACKTVQVGMRNHNINKITLNKTNCVFYVWSNNKSKEDKRFVSYSVFVGTSKKGEQGTREWVVYDVGSENRFTLKSSPGHYLVQVVAYDKDKRKIFQSQLRDVSIKF